MATGLQITFFVLIFIWLGVISFFVLQVLKKIEMIFSEAKEPSVASVLEGLVKGHNSSEKEIKNLIAHVKALEENSLHHVQKTGLVRFNPFSDTGGEQSFILALLDADNTGVVISGLYARSGMRWYVKKVEKGKGAEHELSEEEKKAVSSAR